jgi:hypothetical protein
MLKLGSNVWVRSRGRDWKSTENGVFSSNPGRWIIPKGWSIKCFIQIDCDRRRPKAANLVGLIMQYLTPDRIGRIAAAFNVDSKSTRGVAEVSVPSLLAGFASIALQPGGAQKLVDAVRQHSGTLDSRANSVGSSANQAALADKGTQ